MTKKKTSKTSEKVATIKAPKKVSAPEKPVQATVQTIHVRTQVEPRPVFKPKAEVVWSGTLYRWTTHSGAKTIMHVVPDMVNLVQASGTPASMPIDTRAEHVELVVRD